MKRIFQMIGMPGTGKSTFIKQDPLLSKLPIISTDHHVEQYARAQKKTYTEVFNEYMPEAVKLMMEDAQALKAQNVDAVWDQTSLTISSRKRKFNAFPDYQHIAVWVKNPPTNIWKKRINRPGKKIPEDVIETMLDAFEKPTLEEGFKEIWIVEERRGKKRIVDVITEYSNEYLSL